MAQVSEQQGTTLGRALGCLCVSPSLTQPPLPSQRTEQASAEAVASGGSASASAQASAEAWAGGLTQALCRSPSAAAEALASAAASGSGGQSVAFAQVSRLWLLRVARRCPHCSTAAPTTSSPPPKQAGYRVGAGRRLPQVPRPDSRSPRKRIGHRVRRPILFLCIGCGRGEWKLRSGPCVSLHTGGSSHPPSALACRRPAPRPAASPCAASPSVSTAHGLRPLRAPCRVHRAGAGGGGAHVCRQMRRERSSPAGATAHLPGPIAGGTRGRFFTVPTSAKAFAAASAQGGSTTFAQAGASAQAGGPRGGSSVASAQASAFAGGK